MKIEDAKAITEKFKTLTLHENYSGRGMFGDKTAAISGNSRTIVRALKQAKINPKALRYDTLGHDEIAY